MKAWVASASKWIGLFLTVTAILTAVGGGWWYFQDEKLRNEQWFIDDERWNTAIIATLAEIKEEQAQHRVILDDMASSQTEQFLQRENRFEELEQEHKRLVDAIYQGLIDINFRIGEHQGIHGAQE